MAAKKGVPNPNAGRKKGSLNKVTQDLQGMAQVYTEDALRVLVEIATDVSTHATRAGRDSIMI